MSDIALELEYSKPQLFKKVELQKLQSELTGKHVFSAGDLGGKSTVWGRVLKELEELEIIEPYRAGSSGPRKYYADLDREKLQSVIDIIEHEETAN